MRLETRLLNFELANPVDSPSAPSAWLPETNTITQRTTATVIGQQFDQDVVADFGNALNTFIESGQVWALLVGFVLGYLLRGITTYK